jgi:hypothetical protein
MIVPCVERNLLAFNLDKLATEPVEEMRAALLGRLLHANRDNNTAFFQILMHSTDVINANAYRPELQLQPPIPDATDQPIHRGCKRRVSS